MGGSLPVLLTELEWMLVGERIQDGSILYKEIWTNVGPLASLAYWAIDSSFGRSQYIYEFIAILLTYFQALYFTFICNTRQTFLEKNYIPGLIYVLVMNLSFDLSKPSPILFSVTFLLFAFNVLVKQMERREGVSDEVFEIGLYIGIAALFHQPTLIFIFWALACLVFFTNANIRQHFLTIIGFILPMFLVGLYFYLNNGLNEFKYNWFNGILKIKQYTIEDFKSALISIIVPTILSILGLLRMTRISRFNSYQQRTQQIMLIFGVVGILALFLSPNVAPMQFIVIVPFLAYFITGFFMHLKGTIFPEILFTIFFAFILILQYQGVTPIIGKGFEQLADMRVHAQELPDYMKNKKMLVIGERIDEYQYGKASTCYLNWELSKIDLENPDNYESIINIFENFRKDPPELIVDKKNVVPKIFSRIPALAKDYKASNIKGIYIKK